MKKTLETRHVSKVFGGLTAVSQVDLVVPERSIASIIGPNGAGKTTFFNCITGFYTPEEGDIIFAESSSLLGMSPDKIAYGESHEPTRILGCSLICRQSKTSWLGWIRT